MVNVRLDMIMGRPLATRILTMDGNPPTARLDRREFLEALTLGSGAFALGLSRPSLAGADTPSARAHDWDWLTGNWDVWHRRLKDRLVQSTQWEEFSGKSAFWTTMGG